MNDFQKIGGRLKKHNAVALLICAAGIALNLLLNAVAKASGLPFSLDAVGTVTVAVLGGGLPGVVVGFVTNAVESITDPPALYYGVLNELIAICAAYLAYRGWFKKIPGIFGAAVIFALIGGGIGSIIPWFTEGLSVESGSLGGFLYESGHFSAAAAHVLACILTDLADKTLTVLFAAIVVRLVPERFCDRCSFHLWRQKPVLPDREKEAAKGRTKTRVMSLRGRSLLALVASLTTIAAAGVLIGMSAHHEDVMDERTGLAQSMARLAADVLDGDRIDDYLEKAEDAEGYLEAKDLLRRILNSSRDVIYLYVYRIEEDGCHVVFDIDTESLSGEETGTLIAFDESFVNLVPALLKGEEIEPVVSNDTYGYLLTVYQPVYDTKGNCACYVGADVDLQQVAANERSFLVKMITVYTGYLVLLCMFVLWLVEYYVVLPVKSITSTIDAFSLTEQSQAEMDENVKEFRSIDIHTGDELENLYHSLCSMTLNQTEQMRSIRGLSDYTTKMQDGLIITMADMVENRDSDTGAHIQKTAAYVRIIVNGLKENGYYAEKITPKFISDVVRSAPLHDVGKINIPDEVLNKPGKLTAEEFEIMKTHTTAGRKIMEKAISTVEGENYLKEARNMAAYHHERWDGKGYPEGLHGEAIPLSARIMAVADVFDALTSPRVYKPPFPLEKALSIIQEGAGSQFDAKCVEVFMKALPEVRAVLKKYNEDTDVGAQEVGRNDS